LSLLSWILSAEAFSNLSRAQTIPFMCIIYTKYNTLLQEAWVQISNWSFHNFLSRPIICVIYCLVPTFWTPIHDSPITSSLIARASTPTFFHNFPPQCTVHSRKFDELINTRPSRVNDLTWLRIVYVSSTFSVRVSWEKRIQVTLM
jgi:hypothetical protein